ncbi:hypothetical protein LEP1GSC193_0135 [Leptospira alstonii serovar Pingchang str. 80-412]|uniref:Uncharacterized protein n=2 Tax=Leptospira alstonii TaxID=28452 RepID=M6CX95_9LEPT|nr:hypothetical protein LEP1GSC194_2700 [Leptospira alstonii serovar Sichuan str. 79601]EQA82224.1 hypothetical protein LEP1GSC193_0135 [Leptospira alstonii serovar Pingchang str. 80-412]
MSFGKMGNSLRKKSLKRYFTPLRKKSDSYIHNFYENKDQIHSYFII